MQERSRIHSYLAVVKISFRNARAYTVDFVTHFVYFPAQLLALNLVYSIMYLQNWLITGSTVIGGFTFFQLISYLFVTILLQRMLPRFRMGWEIERDIDRGNLIGYLSKPIDYAGYRFSRELPRSLLYFAFGTITYGVGVVLLRIPLPTSLNFVLAIPFFLSAYAISFLLIYTIALATFWFGRHWWLRSLINLVMVIVGGGLIPLTFFPPLIQFFFNLLPFQYCYAIPATILLGLYHPNQLLSIFLLNIAWLIILWLLMRIVWKLGRNRYEGAGG